MVDGEPDSDRTWQELLALIRAQATMAGLKARVGDLERQRGLNSSNSDKSPSTNGLTTPQRTRGLREASGRKRWRQKGHNGETLPFVARMSRSRNLVAGTEVKGHARGRLPDRRQDPMAACGLHHPADLLPRRRLHRGHNLLVRLVTRNQDVLRFLADPKVPSQTMKGNATCADESRAKHRRRLSAPAGAMDFDPEVLLGKLRID